MRSAMMWSARLPLLATILCGGCTVLFFETPPQDTCDEPGRVERVLREAALATCARLGLAAREAVVACTPAPALETPAEVGETAPGEF